MALVIFSSSYTLCVPVSDGTFVSFILYPLPTMLSPMCLASGDRNSLAASRLNTSFTILNSFYCCLYVILCEMWLVLGGDVI